MSFPQYKIHCITCDCDMTEEYNKSDCKQLECSICINSKLLKVLNENPKNEDDVIIKRIVLRKQRDELHKQPNVNITCVCGFVLPLKMAYRCWFCGLTLCVKCAKKHFGPKKLMGHEYIDKDNQ